MSQVDTPLKSSKSDKDIHKEYSAFYTEGKRMLDIILFIYINEQFLTNIGMIPKSF